MTFFERLFAIKIIDLRASLTTVKEVLFQHNKTSEHYREHYPTGMRLRVYLHKDNYIGKLNVSYTVRSLTTNEIRYVSDEVEVKIRDRKQHTIASVNELYRKAVKEFVRRNKEKGFKECLLVHFSISDTFDEYKFKYERDPKVVGDFKPLK